MRRTKGIILYVSLFFVFACSTDSEKGPIGVSELPDGTQEQEEEVPPIEDEALLDLTQRETLKYFWDFAEENSGAARERYHPNDPSNDAHTVTSGGTGFGLMAILVGIERGFISRDEGVERLGQILNFLENADRFHGAWPHWINGANGNVIPFSEMDNGGDLVETSFLAQGLVCVTEYFKAGSGVEKELANKADILWKGVEWNWYTNNKNLLYWHWSPNFQFAINHELHGYNEVLITFIMAAASPDYTISKAVYDTSWASNGAIVSSNTKYDYPLYVKHNGAEEYGGPLFWAHYSFMGLNPKGLSDAYTDYGAVNTNHSQINYHYCVANPNNFAEYGKDCWGLTASYTRNSDGSIGYAAHSPSNDTGVISPTAAISSMPYTPDESMRALRYFYKNKSNLLGPAGFYDAFSPEYNFWVTERYLAIDQGPIINMIENHRTGLLWNLFMRNADVQAGLDKLGFSYVD